MNAGCVLEPTHIDSVMQHRHAQFMAISLRAGGTWKSAAVIVLCKVRCEILSMVSCAEARAVTECRDLACFLSESRTVCTSSTRLKPLHICFTALHSTRCQLIGQKTVTDLHVNTAWSTISCMCGRHISKQACHVSSELSTA